MCVWCAGDVHELCGRFEEVHEEVWERDGKGDITFEQRLKIMSYGKFSTNTKQGI